MIKINLLSERKATRVKAAKPGLKFDVGGNQNVLLAGILILGFLVAGGWWWARARDLEKWRQENRKADAILVQLEEVRKKAEEYKHQKAVLERKINLITTLKKNQAVPVHIVDQVSKNLPDFLWLDSMTANRNQINIGGKATTYNSVSNFYNNLNASGYFSDVVMGRVAEVADGVQFSLTCTFVPPGDSAQAPGPQG
jgi:type IV pilus assembly protein PilN